MPKYNYICKKCEDRISIEAKISEIADIRPYKCEKCGGEVDIDLSGFQKQGVIWKCDGAFSRNGQKF